MDTLELIRTRRSIRKFQPKEVPQEALQQILEAVRWAPSWNNTQCWEVVVLQPSPMRAEVLACVPKFNPAYKAMEEAPLVLVICGKREMAGYYQGKPTTKHGDWLMYDLGLATQNLCLMAHALGLGTVIVGFFDHNKVKENLGLPDDYEAVCILPLGYPAQESKPPRRREISEFCHEGRFS